MIALAWKAVREWFSSYARLIYAAIAGAIVLGIAAALWWTYHAGVKHERASWELKMAEQRAKYESLARDKEHEWAGKLADAEQRHADDQVKIDGATSRVADLEQRVRAQRCSDKRVPPNTTTASGSPKPDPGKPHVLPGPDDSRFAKLALEADRVLSRLRLCQAYAMSISK